MVAPPAAAATNREVAELTVELDPAPGSSMLALLRRATEDGAEGLAERLREIVRSLADREVRIVFGGHFSCGKSTLINTLISRPLLPTSDYPETGVPCVVRSGTTDRIHSITEGGRVGLPFGTESIAREVSLIGDNGEYSTTVHAVRRLVVSLRGNVPPRGVLWIDSPGINDTAAMTRRAAIAAEDADVLVWVVNSRQPLSEVEQAFLREHVASHGAAGVVFVVNVFLPADDTHAWSRYVEERAAYFRARIADTGISDPFPSVVVFVSARATAAHPGGFGGPEVRELLTALSNGRHPRGLATRCHRAGRRLELLVDDVRRRAAPERSRVDRLRTERAEIKRRADRQRSRFERQVVGALTAAFLRRDAMIEERVAAIVDAMTTQDLLYDDSYGTRLTREIGQIARQLKDEIVREVNRSAATNGRGRLSRSALDRIGSLLHPEPVVIEVPRNPVSSGHRGLGAVIGGVLGTLIVPVLGSAIGVGLGAALGGVGDHAAAALAKDRAGATANALAAGGAATAALRAQQTAVQQIVTDPAAAPPELPDPPDTSRLQALDTLVKRLTAAAHELRRLGASLASEQS